MIHVAGTAMRLGLIAGGWLAITIAIASAQGLWPERGPYSARVTTDSAEYCAHLLARIGHARARAEEPEHRADVLAAEGRRMCAAGHIRPGIARLRRALLLLEDRK
jgi:hypothetical protein